MRLYIGTYTQRGSKGVYVYRFEPATGELFDTGQVAETSNPSFLALHPSGRYLYACNEVGNDPDTGTGAVSAFAIDADTGGLSFLNKESAHGTVTCYAMVDETGGAVAVANYGSGSLASLPIAGDGRLNPAATVIQHEGGSVNPQRQEGPHAHCIRFDPSNRFALSCDLGTDRVDIYRFDPQSGTLTPNDPAGVDAAPGSGPRHLAFHPSGRFVYVIHELDNTIAAYGWDGERGALSLIHTISTLPPDFTGTSHCAEVLVHPSGRFVYGSNRGHDSLAMFAVNEADGRLLPLGQTPTGGENPRNFTIDPSGTWLLCGNQETDNIVVFRIEPEAGRLQATGHSASLSMPVCLRLLA